MARERDSSVHPVNGEVPPVKGRPWKLPHYANRGKTSSSGGELASARSCFSTVRTALGKLRITGLLARFDVARSFPQFPRPLLLQPTIWTSERGADLGSGRCQPRPHLPIYRMTRFFPVALVKRALIQLDRVNYAASINDLRVPPGNRLERLRGARDGQYSIRVSRGWRICFVWKDGDAFEVELTNHYD